MVAVINLDAYPFLFFSDRCFSVALSVLIVLETKLGSSHQEASPSAGKKTEVVFVPFHIWNCVTIAISGGVDITEFPGYHLLRQMSSQFRVTKINSRVGFL